MDEAPLIEKICTKCGTIFTRKAKKWVPYCPICLKQYRKARYEAGKGILTPEEKRDKYLRWAYNITLEQYNQLLAEQNGVCAICGKPENIDPNKKGRGVSHELKVDHDHKTGSVRALLCNHCNVALGLIERDPRRIQAIARYMRKHKPKSQTYQQIKDLFSLDEEAAD